MECYDLLIIGGGINGTAIAAEAAARGLSVLLVEQGDLGGGTSAASSKLIHGGLRYLQYGELGLVREALRDRERLLRHRPHLVRPIELLIPVHEGGPVPPWKLEAGLRLYDALAGASHLPRHRHLSRKETLGREPHLEPAGLQGGFLYPDAQALFPERLCVELAQEAAAAGAVIRTHTPVVAFRREHGRVVGALLGEGQSAFGVRRSAFGSTGESPELGMDAPSSRPGPNAERRTPTADCEAIAARLTINAAGPWVDVVRRLLADPARPLLGGTKGSHLVIPPPPAGPRGPLYAPARSDGRPFFILPWRELLLIGTTDMRYEGDPAQVRTTPDEIDYLLAETAALFPIAHFAREQISYTYSGVRPLPQSEVPAARITRRHQVVDHAGEGAPGLWSIVGGKLTTHPSLAAQTVDRALAWLRRPPTRVRTQSAALDLPALRRSVAAQAVGTGLDAAQVEHLVTLYGPRAGEVVERVRREPALAERLCPHNPDVASQVVHAVECEWAESLADLLLRRTGIGGSACLGLDCAERAADQMARAAGWNADRRAAEVAAYRELIACRYRSGL
jgi:glycerol-3-phosphate dehydrogenase